MSTADLLEQVVRASGVSPVEWYPDWRTRGWATSNGAPFNPQIVVWHHTWLPVPFPLSVLADGRPDVAGPLCHLNIKPDKLVVIAGEGANHGGPANESVYRDALKGIAHDLTAAQRGLADSSEAWHEWAWGVEVDWAGSMGDPVTNWQDQAIKKLLVAWHEVQGLVPGNHITHAETTSRKWDPGFTRSIWKPYRDWLTEQLEDDMAQFTDVEVAQLRRLLKTWVVATGTGDQAIPGTQILETSLNQCINERGVNAYFGIGQGWANAVEGGSGGGNGHGHLGQPWFEDHVHKGTPSGTVKP